MAEQGPWLDVDLGAVLRNARQYAGIVGVRLLPMVKANAYGLGVVPVARTLEALAPWGFGVASVSEGRALRQAGIGRPIVVFWPFDPSLLDEYVGSDLRPAIGDVDGLRAWLAAGSKGSRPFHVSIDTGMSRAGFRWHDAAGIAALRELVTDAPGFEGIYTHFASADLSSEATEVQWTRFRDVVSSLGGPPPLIHAANSAAAQWGDRFAGNLARPGIFLYGGAAGRLEPEPVATLSGRVLAIRSIRAGDPVSYGATWRAAEPAEIATIAIGYADGVLRSQSGKGEVLVNGRVAPIAGRVTMDMTMVVVPPGGAKPGDRAVLFGDGLALDRQAERAGTIAYELLTAVGPRVIRRYRGEP
jgi:alanine racemase